MFPHKVLRGTYYSCWYEYIYHIYIIYLYIEYYAVYQTYYVCNHAFSVELVVATAASCWPKLFSFPMYLHFMIISHQSSGCHSAYDSQPCCWYPNGIDLPCTLQSGVSSFFLQLNFNLVGCTILQPFLMPSPSPSHQSVAHMNPQHEHSHQHDSSSSPLWKLPLSYNIWLHHHSPEIFSTIASDHSAYVGFLK